MQDDSDKVWATIAVCLFTVLWRFVNRIIGPKISVFFYKKYLDFDASTRLVWNTYVTSTIHSIVVCILTLCLFKFYPEVTTTARQGPGPKAYQIIMSFSTGYFLSDMYVLIRYHYLFGKKIDLIHHVISVVATFYVAVTGHIPFWGSLQILHEFSTPIVNLRWFLLTCGIGKERIFVLGHHIIYGFAAYYCAATALIPYWSGQQILHEVSTPWVNARWFLRLCLDKRRKERRRYTIVCFMMLFTFFACRILPIPYFWYTLIPACYMSPGATCNIKFIQAFGFFFFGMDCLNLYWFRLMISVFYRALAEKLVQVRHKIKLHFRFQEDEEEEYHECDNIDVSEFSTI